MISEIYKNDISASLYSYGNNFRIKKALEKDEVRIAFSGGSITKGWNGERYIKEDYTKIFFEYMTAKYDDKKICYSNYSTESANSFMGLSITSKEITDDNLPDIVFIEYAVNNECTREHMISFESLVHKMLSLPSKPAVILLFMINQSFYSSQGYMKKIGEHYRLPMFSIADTLSCMIKEKGFEWSTYSDDWIHPNGWGQRFIAECIINYFETLSDMETDEEVITGSPVYSVEYSGYRPYPPEKVIMEGYEKQSACEFFENGMKMKNDLTNKLLKFEADFRHLFITYKHDKTERFSDADVYIDGKKAALIQGKSIYGWGNVVLKHVCSFDSSAHHTVEIKVKDNKKEFFIAEFGIC